MSLHKFPLSLERLETRQMQAGDVAANLSGKILYLNEAAGHVGESNQVVVSELSDGRIHVTGFASNGAPSKINGAASAEFMLPGNDPADLIVDFGDGNDLLQILPGTKLGSAKINMSVSGAEDADTVDINGLTTTGALQINTGGGDDKVFIQNSHIGDGSGVDELKIRSAADSEFTQNGSNTRNDRDNHSLQSHEMNEANVDRVIVQLTSNYHDILVDTGAGDDTVQLANTAGKDVVTNSGDGQDNMTLHDVRVVDQLFVLLGGGDDTLDLQRTQASFAFVDGGVGIDKLVNRNDVPTNDFATQEFEFLNGGRLVDFGSVANPDGGTIVSVRSAGVVSTGATNKFVSKKAK